MPSSRDVSTQALSAFALGRLSYPLVSAPSAGTGGPEATTTADSTRNFGIVAHVDSGKTTVSERMLYYAAPDRVTSLGDVHHGNTQMDFMAVERERGITVQSAAACFEWPRIDALNQPPRAIASESDGSNSSGSDRVRLNLVDTPGHVDFSAEVLQSLRVLDGCVVALDGAAGVQAQTRSVVASGNSLWLAPCSVCEQDGPNRRRPGGLHRGHTVSCYG